MPKGSLNLKAWARVGAQQRLRELDEERAAIFSAFPELRIAESPFPRRRGRPRKVQGVGGGDGVGTRKRKRRRMSKEARAKISAAQKARWANQNKAVKGK